ncbi:MAG TPA: hypothetical protein VFV65_04625 [Gemmatimonadales bacterium]|nr:hypothetical protein [Gemmatimonadales bacterium]
MKRWLSVVLLAAWLPACVRWEAATIAPESTLPANRQFKVWIGGTATELRAVRVSRDSLSGLPIGAPARCDSCRVSVPLAVVDSTQSQSSDVLPVILIAGPLLFFVVALVRNQGIPTGGQPVE